MSKTFYVTTETRQQTRKLFAMKGDDQEINIDFSPWAEDNATLTTATWSVEYGDASVDGEALSSNVATARITTSEAGKSLIKLSVTDGTRTKVIFLHVHAKDPEHNYPVEDYGMARL